MLCAPGPGCRSRSLGLGRGCPPLSPGFQPDISDTAVLAACRELALDIGLLDVVDAGRGWERSNYLCFQLSRGGGGKVAFHLVAVLPGLLLDAFKPKPPDANDTQLVDKCMILSGGLNK